MELYKTIKFVKRVFLLFISILFIFGCSSNKAAVKENQAFNSEESLKKANDLIERGNYEEAREILENVKARDASQQYATLAKLRIADTYFENESYEEAATEYETFLKADPYNKYASYAQYKLAMSFFKQVKTIDISYSTALKALEEFERLQRNYPRNPYMDVTENRIKACQRMLSEYEFYVGSFYFKKGSYEAAAQRFNKLLNNYPDVMKVPEALYYLGLSYEKMGQKGLAIKTLKILTDKFPSLELSKEAQKHLVSFGYLIIKSDNEK
ncbi:MAG: outer membrane protein assembly factor BamD [Nitrospirae bacterium]|nr:outer membrane protein assembly factor BamD [Nitrospirota bacterium]